MYRSKMPSPTVPSTSWLGDLPRLVYLFILDRLRSLNMSLLIFADQASVGSGKTHSASFLLCSKRCSLSRTSGALPVHLLVSV